MHHVRYHLAISLDGFIAPEDGSAAWLEPYGKVAGGFIGPWMKNIGGIIVGRTTYDQSAGMGGWQWGETPALVMTSRPLPKKHPKTLEASDDPSEGLKALRARMQPKANSENDIWLFGGGVAAATFLKANLIDLIELAVVPIVLGKGRPLFADTAVQLTFEAAGSLPIGMGVVVNSYRRIEKPIRRTAARSARQAKSR